MAVFLALAALMLAAALAFVLPPLLRGATQARFVTLAVAMLLPIAAVLLYLYAGNPKALDQAALSTAADHGNDMDQAVAGLAAKLTQDPDDAQGWALLGRAYEAMERFAEARDALAHAHSLVPDDAEVTVAYAEALALSTESHRVEGEPRVLIEGVLKKAPDNQRGLWLLGISDYQQGKYDAAIASWKHLIDVLPTASDIVPSVREQIAQAEAARDGREPAAPGAKPAQQTAATTTATSDSGPHLQVEVALDAKLADKLAPSDVLFVYAKAASGPAMPLAVQRMPASKLPASVTLTDNMGMLPNMKLSQFPQVIVGARVSKTGNALAQSGDLQTVSKPLPVSTKSPVKLTIDQIVP
jgi:cytochrome c-type biogenesis protein CcmH